MTTLAQRAALPSSQPSPVAVWFVKCFLILLPFASAWASTITIAGLPPVRLLVVALVVAALAARPKIEVVSQVLIAVGMFWVAMGLFLMKSPEGLKEILGVVVGLLTMISVTLVGHGLSWIILMCRAWLGGVIIAIIPGFYEIATGKHMPNYRLGAAEWVRKSATDIASFMVNPNLFAYFITAGMVALIVGWQLEKGWLKWTYVVVALMVPPVTWFTGSRLCVAACVVLLAWMCVRSRVLMTLAAVGACAGAAVVVTTGMVPALIAAYNTFVENLSSNSGQTRLHLYQNAGWMFVDTKGVGIGPGRYARDVADAPWRTYGAVDPHNGFTEVFVGYGLMVGVVLVALALATLIATLRRAGGHPGHIETVLLQAVGVSLVICPILALANSSYLKAPVVWCQMATIALWCQYLLAPGLVPRRSARYAIDGTQRLPRRRRVLARALSTSQV
ncbi:beta-carotene 15,15'-monooxygenase [Cutibacterium sp. WCA-380-WT-3A]|uniref:Beta-carotene 15,15'-monooxygenase n=1 Tax=Cutibacterium porci TaxID=2605781 RepID=A0A7K0J4C6_9ACTN|nr:O-antigen ligase family protein [Cutibacterium porci]MSS44786.1 beta-carotene 15,15'-monooxygenase [Cutibacterium porci]